MIRFLSVFLLIFYTSQTPENPTQENFIKVPNNTIRRDTPELQVVQMRKSIDSLQQEIETQTQLSHNLTLSIETANSVINKQNSLINGFGVIFTVLTLLVAFVPIAQYFISIRPIIKDAKGIINRADLALDKNKQDFLSFRKEIEERLEERFNVFQEKSKKKVIDQALTNLSSYSEDLQRSALTYLSNSVSADELGEIQLSRISILLRRLKFSENETEKLASFLYYKKGENTDDFFLNLPLYPNIYRIESIRYYAYRYLLMSNLPDRLECLTKLILVTDCPTKDYIKAIGWISSDHKELVLDLINHKNLNINSKIDKVEVFAKLKESSFEDLRSKINQSYLSELLAPMPDKTDPSH